MTAAQQESQEELHAAPSSGPGARLREIRISRKLTVDDVAAQLRLDPPRLEALENDAYDKLAGPTFVRGYLRGYARLVGVPAGPLLEAYDRYGFDTPALVPDITSRPQIRSSDIPVRLVTYVLAAALLAMVGVWWFSHREAPTTQAPVAGGSADLPEAVLEADEPVILPPPPAPFMELESEAVPLTVPDAMPEETMPAAEDTEPADVVDEAAPGVAESPAEPAPTEVAQDTADETPVEPAAAEEVPAAGDHLEISFVNDSWVEIEDAGGEKLFYGTAKGGETIDVRGTPPLKVVLGYAHEVQVKYNDRLFDHRPFINKGLARFTLGRE